MRTPDDIYEDFASRREGVLTALVHDTEAFFKACDPARENLCLYGEPLPEWPCLRCPARPGAALLQRAPFCLRAYSGRRRPSLLCVHWGIVRAHNGTSYSCSSALATAQI
jgi:hypothetical protein